MKTNQSEINHSKPGDPCCKGSGNWIQLNNKLRQIAWRALWLLALVNIIFIAMGYFLDPVTVRILWMTVNSALLILILPLLAFWKKWIRKNDKEVESNQPSIYNQTP